VLPWFVVEWFVYLLRCADDTLYCGVCTDLERRVQEHNSSPRGARYTRARRPVSLVWQQEAESRSAACREEARIKRLPRGAKEQLIGTGQ
jgi:putative endonuclease